MKHKLMLQNPHFLFVLGDSTFALYLIAGDL